MKISIASDIHLEFGDLDLRNSDGAEVLILSGDICVARDVGERDAHNIRGEWDRSNRIHAFFERCASEFAHVIYCVGNHEHYHGKFYKTWHELIAEMPDNVEVLEQQSVEIDGVLFLGGTLWTSCNKGDPMTHMVLKNGMNDYRAITFHDRVRNIYRKLDPKDTLDEYSHTVQYFHETIEANPDKKVVVCTHHAPSFQSVHEHYRHDREMNGGYASSLEEFILDHPQIKFWTHGHMHDPSDYMIGDCRVIANPRGYYGYERRVHEFDPTVGFDIMA